jgi:predicted transcriptional regulator
MSDHPGTGRTPEIAASELRRLTAEIVAAHVSHNSVPTGDVGRFIVRTHAALQEITQGRPNEEAAKPVPAVSVRASIKPDYIVCLEDGKKLKLLKKHLARKYDMTPDDYRRRWGLRADYPMVAPNYAQRRSELAKSIGLGRKPEPAPTKKASSRKSGVGRGKARAKPA